jgi:hypothetical protein
MGDPDRRAAFEVAGHSAEVYKWAAARNPEGVTLYTSIGGCEFTGHDYSEHRTEFVVGLLPEQDEVAWPVARLALSAILNGAVLRPGNTITYPEPLWPGTEMRSFLVRWPNSPLIPDLQLAGGVHVAFLQAIPLFDHEVEYKIAHDPDALLDAMEHEDVPFWDPNRVSLSNAFRSVEPD